MGFKSDNEKQNKMMPGCLRSTKDHAWVGIFIAVTALPDENCLYDRGLILSMPGTNVLKIVPLDSNFGFMWWDELFR